MAQRAHRGDHRQLYDCYLKRREHLGDPWCAEDLSFLEYARLVKIDHATGAAVRRYANVDPVDPRVAIGVSYDFELYDTYIGQFVAMNYAHTIADRNKLCAPPDGPDSVPENTRYLAGAIKSAVTPGWVINRAIRKRDDPFFARMFTDAETMSDPAVMSHLALEFLLRDMVEDLKLSGLKAPRCSTFTLRLNAIRFLLEAHAGRLRCNRDDLPQVSMIDASQWKHRPRDTMPERTWSQGQAKLLKLISEGVKVEDANAVYSQDAYSRFIFASGEPGAGKSEAVVYAAWEAAKAGAHVFIGCPTGVLVSGYLDRLPGHPRICCETIHSGFKIGRKVDCDKHNPPSRLRRYELFIIDEVSFLDNAVARTLIRAILELPQKPLVVFVGDLSQLQPIHGGEIVREFLLADAMTSVDLEQHVYARTQDKVLLDFLHFVRASQPSLKQLREFFGSRYLGRKLSDAVRRCRSMRSVDQTPVIWLTCTKAGAMEVNYEYLRQLEYGTKETIMSKFDAYPCDIDYGGEPMIVRSGMWLRLTRNLDKKRGFCNGAMGQVIDVLRSEKDGVMFTMRLTHGAMVVVHPIRVDDKCFLPCVYGYAMTTRKAQGSSMDFAVLYFDLFRPASRGFAYVGSSRVRSHTGLFYFGKVRRSDWLPVGGTMADQQVTRGSDSEDTAESDRAPSESDYEESSDPDGLSIPSDVDALRNDSDSDYGRGFEWESNADSDGGADAMATDSDGDADAMAEGLGADVEPMMESSAVQMLLG